MTIKSKVLGILLVVGFLFSESITAKEIIKIAHADGDMTTTVRNAIENAKEKDIQLIFEKGIYKFLPDYAVGKFLYITNHGNGFKKIIPRTRISPPKINASTNPVAAISEASFTSPAPSLLDI